MLHLHNLFVGVGNEVLNDILLAQPVPAVHGVIKMIVEAVVRPRHRGGTAFRGHRVTAHRVDFGNQRNFQRRIRFRNRDRRPQSCATRAYNRHVRLENFHCLPPSAQNPQDFNPNSGSVSRSRIELHSHVVQSLAARPKTKHD